MNLGKVHLFNRNTNILFGGSEIFPAILTEYSYKEHLINQYLSEVRGKGWKRMKRTKQVRSWLVEILKQQGRELPISATIRPLSIQANSALPPAYQCQTQNKIEICHLFFHHGHIWQLPPIYFPKYEFSPKGHCQTSNKFLQYGETVFYNKQLYCYWNVSCQIHWIMMKLSPYSTPSHAACTFWCKLAAPPPEATHGKIKRYFYARRGRWIWCGHWRCTWVLRLLYCLSLCVGFAFRAVSFFSLFRSAWFYLAGFDVQVCTAQLSFFTLRAHHNYGGQVHVKAYVKLMIW